MSLLKDERGSWSTARVALMLVLGVALWLSLKGPTRQAEVWSYLEAITLALIGWAGGARVSQYISMLRKPSAPPPPTDGTL